MSGLFINNTGVPQVFYDGNRETRVIPKQGLAPKRVFNSVSGFPDFDNKNLKIFKNLSLHRSFALGDVLMLIPIIREMRKQGFKNPSISTINGYKEVLGNYVTKDFDAQLILDGFLELDHSVREYSLKHRVDIYRELVGLKKNGIANEWILDSNVSEKIENIKNPYSDYIAIQYSGSHDKLKRLNWNTLNDIIKFLVKNNQVIVFGENHKKFDNYNNFVNLTGKTNLFQMWNLIRKSKMLLCLDSGPLWVSHFEKKPSIVFLGPTRIQERLTYHPLFGSGAVQGIALNQIYGCESCFESMKTCGGKVSCMNLFSSLVLPEFITAFKEVTQWLEEQKNK